MTQKSVRARGARTYLLALALFCFSATHQRTVAEPAELQTLRADAVRYLELDPKAAREHAGRLSAVQAAALLSQVQLLARTRNPDIDRLSYLVRQLEEQRATEVAQRRLDNLLLVIGLSLVLFTGFLVYVLLQQRRDLARAAQLLARHTPNAGSGPVYRGE